MLSMFSPILVALLILEDLKCDESLQCERDFLMDLKTERKRWGQMN